ncbi:pentatricopeptide repeat-containing protein [Prunus yedoensis var. nudiflora]|uniref:Pentatricopeptide repeat-containing protein n=1 Tax=Prunus yedoensis var. nudiflora TaxID=2094558 RepID=A0A314ZKY9_PRUYE|nr:pentatricopeptide repeat-containing protein [Prunus yedoensis var. nudiflora]
MRTRTLLRSLLAQDPTCISFYAPIFQSLTGQNLLKLGQQVHAQMALRGLEPNAFLGAKMVAMYAISDDLASAVNIFHRVNNRSTLLYNSIIRAYTLYGYSEKTMEIYGQMRCLALKGDKFTYTFVRKCCSLIGLESDMYVGTCLIDIYVKCSEMSDARSLFDKMTVRDFSCWNALISGNMKDGEICFAEDLFRRMPCKNIVSWTAIISGYTQNGLAEQTG